VDETTTPLNYIGTNTEDRPSLFNPTSSPPPQELAEPCVSTLIFGDPIDSEQAPDQLHTPPLMSKSGAYTLPDPSPGRRTKVSIDDIVEQPPTPTSLNGTKRKADVLEEEQNSAIHTWNALPGETVTTSEHVTTDAAAQTANIIARRPKKQPKSVLGKIRNAATYSLLGAAGAIVTFGALSTLPDSFFT